MERSKNSSDDNTMTESGAAMQETRRPRRWLWPSKKSVVVFIAFLGVVVSVFFYYSSHLYFRYEASRLELHDISAIPDHPMPNSPAPGGWKRCRVDLIEFSLPPELADNRVAPKKGESFIKFEHGSRTVIVAFPTDASEFTDFIMTASDLRPQSQHITLPQLRRECYQASSEDFRWSMTPKEVRWHAFCITTGQLMRTKSHGFTESYVSQDFDGIIDFGDKPIYFEWQSNDRMYGNMIFIDRKDNVDLTWIRTVCQSLKVSSR
jgi:hypothetical protein